MPYEEHILKDFAPCGCNVKIKEIYEELWKAIQDRSNQIQAIQCDEMTLEAEGKVYQN